MSRFIINGGVELSGSVDVSGSKNAALPLIFASLLTRGVSVIRNVPQISDVDVALRLISDEGAEVSREKNDLFIKTDRLKYVRPTDFLVSKIRASSYLMGANLARFGICHLQSFGGCNFDTRPIDMHIDAMKAMGASQLGDTLVAASLSGADIHFRRVSVGATVNALFAASLAKGRSRIYGYAKEPHVISLVEYLRSAGAEITLYGDRIEVVGAELVGAEGYVIPDMIEAGTFLSLSLLTDSHLTVKGANAEHLASFTDSLESAGANISFSGGAITAEGALSGFLSVVAEPYPGFPTDLQPVTAPLMARFFGGRITERVWNARFGYLSELEKFGVRYDRCEGGAVVRPSELHSAQAKAPDLRGGAALLMCALSARGESVIDSAEIIKRGYSDVLNKLRQIGAEIKEVK